MSKDQIKEIFNSITCIRILIAKEGSDKADDVAWELQQDILEAIINE